MADMIDVLLASCKHGSGGGSYNDSELRSKIADLQAKVDQCGTNIEAIQEVLEAHKSDIDALKDALQAQETTLTDLAQRLAEAEAAVTGLEAATTQNAAAIAGHETRIQALEANGGGSGAECDGECCVQHSILNGNWFGDEEPAELTTWDEFVNYCKDNFTEEELIGYVIQDDGSAEATFNIVGLTRMTNALTNKEYECAVLQSAYAVGEDIPFDVAEKVLATGKYETNKYYYKMVNNNYVLLTAGTDYQVGASITQECYVNDVCDEQGAIIAKGYNDWSLSFVRQYLNNESPADYHTTHIGDVLPEAESLLSSVYKEGISQDLLNHIMPVKVAQNGHESIDKIVLPSVTQMNGIASPAIGEPLTYWVNKMLNCAPTNAAKSGRIIKNQQGTAVYAALLDCESTTLYRRAYILKSATAGGEIRYSSVFNPTAFQPLMYLPIKEVE